MEDRGPLPAALGATPHRGQRLQSGEAGLAAFWAGVASCSYGPGSRCVELAFEACRVSARRPTHFLLLRQKKVSKEKASRMRCPSLRFGAAALLGPRGVWLNSPSAQTTPALIRASLRYSPAHDGEGWVPPSAALSVRQIRRGNPGRRAKPVPRCSAFETRSLERVRPLAFPATCRVAGLSSAAVGGSGRALSERSEFSPTPPGASSARHRKAARTSARLSFAYFSLAKQRKVSRRRGETRHVSQTKTQ